MCGLCGHRQSRCCSQGFLLIYMVEIVAEAARGHPMGCAWSWVEGPQVWFNAALLKSYQTLKGHWKHAQGHSPLLELPDLVCAAKVMHEEPGTAAATFAGGSIR